MSKIGHHEVEGARKKGCCVVRAPFYYSGTYRTYSIKTASRA